MSLPRAKYLKVAYSSEMEMLSKKCYQKCYQKLQVVTRMRKTTCKCEMGKLEKFVSFHLFTKNYLYI